MKGDPFGDMLSGASVEEAAEAPDLSGRIMALERLGAPELRSTWKTAWKAPAPKGARKRFLMLGIAWRWQADVFGGIDPELARRLSALEARVGIGEENTSKSVADVIRAARPVPGTRLIRDWQGIRYEVHVTESGYLWQGSNYGSLSAVARAITGTSQNGPKFFGLRAGQGAR